VKSKGFELWRRCCPLPGQRGNGAFATVEVIDDDLGCSANGMKAQARLRATGGPARFSMLRKLWGDRHYHDTAAIATETARLSGWPPGSTRRLRSAS